MDPDTPFDDLVARLRDDNVSGASELSRTAADVLREAAVRIPAGSLDELRRKLGEVGRRVVEAQPSMAPMVTLVRDVLEAVEGAGGSEPGDDDPAPDRSVEAGRHAAARAADAFRSRLESRADDVVAAAATVLPTGGVVGTISASGTVRRLVESEAGPRGLRVVCFESRPMREGRALAAALRDAGVEVVYAVDAAIDSLVPECNVVIFGTDAVGDAGVTNKIGSKALARAAGEAGVPVYVLAGEAKLLPRGHPQVDHPQVGHPQVDHPQVDHPQVGHPQVGHPQAGHPQVGHPRVVGDDRPADEVWADAPAGVTVWNRYFEVVPMDLVTGFVMERGVLSAEEVAELRASLRTPEQLAR